MSSSTRSGRPGIGAGRRTSGPTHADDVTCVIHVHSTFSDGTATVPEIAAAAGAAGARAVLLTDHDSREAARQGLEGWHGEVLVLVGHEITTRGGHFLAFDVEEEIEHRGLSEQAICEQVFARGGFGFAAHPFSRGGVVPSIIRPHPWSALEQCHGCGIELWSLVTDAAERWRNPIAALRFLRDPAGTIVGPPPENLARWDRLCRTRRVPAIGGLDAHQTGLRIGRRVLSPMPHSRYFRLLRTHLLLERPLSRDLRADRASIYGALREGRCYLCLEGLGSPAGFAFHACAPDGRMAPMGSEVGDGSWTLHAHVPRPATLRLLRDGRPVELLTGNELEFRVPGAGVYRLELTLSSEGLRRIWIITNPIYVRG